MTNPLTDEEVKRNDFLNDDTVIEKDKVKFLMEETFRKYALFEENNELTRVKCKLYLLQELVYLGCADRCCVVCDETNNTIDIIDNNDLQILVVYQTVEQKESAQGECIQLIVQTENVSKESE